MAEWTAAKYPVALLAVAKMQLAQLLCQRGESRQSLADGDGAACRECPTGEIRLVAVDKARFGPGFGEPAKYRVYEHVSRVAE